MSPFTASDSMASVRQNFRAFGRKVLCDQHNMDQHMERIRYALKLPDDEPAQGALADLFFGCRHANASEKRLALAAVRERLSPAAGRWFEAYVSTPAFPSCSRMATRWSVLVNTSLNVPRRALRCSADDSRQLAAAALEAWSSGDEPAQEEFLTHCRVCRDTLAFMLARKGILQKQSALPAEWNAAFSFLQQAALTS